MRQRKKQPEQTRRAILAAAGGEFAKAGYSGTGLGAITAGSGLTKGALFHHFPDKRHLALAWIREDLATELAAVWIQPMETVESLDALAKLGRSRGMELRPDDALCALVLLAAETAATEPLLSDALGSLLDDWKNALASLLNRGKAGGWIHPSIQAENEAVFLVSAFCGLAVMARCAADPSLRRSWAASLDAYLETLRPQ